MTTHFSLSTIARRVLAGVCVIAASGCGSEMLRTGRAPVYLVVQSMQGQPGGGGDESTFLLSDVETVVNDVPTIFNDSATAVISAQLKNPAVSATTINSVTLTRFHVTFRRADGRNTPGVDVPYGFDGPMSVTIAAGSSQAVAFEIVRHQAKLEPPLRNLVAGGGQGFISTIGEVTFYGRDQNGNEVSVTGFIDVQFGDFGDK